MARMAFLLALVALVGTAEVRSARAQDPRPVPLARRGVRAACPRTIDAALSAIGTKGGIGPDPTLQRADAAGQLAGIRDGGAASDTWRVTAAALSLRVSFVVPLRDSATHPRAGPLRRAL